MHAEAFRENFSDVWKPLWNAPETDGLMKG